MRLGKPSSKSVSGSLLVVMARSNYLTGDASWFLTPALFVLL